MTIYEIGWGHWRTFLAVIECGNLSGAARSLGLTQPTVGRHIDAIESGLGTSLFTRSQLGLAPTGRALALIPYAKDMKSAAEALARTAFNKTDETSGVVRLAASHVVGVEILPPILADFRNHYPAITIELALSNEQDDLLRRDADIAIRMTQPTQERLSAKKIGEVGIGLFGTKEYFERNEFPRQPTDLFDHNLVGLDRDSAQLADINVAGRQLTREDFSFRCDSDLGQLSALRAGLGIGVCQIGIAARDERLVPVLPDQIMFGLGMWLVMHEDLKTDQRVRLLFDHLADALPSRVG